MTAAALQVPVILTLIGAVLILLFFIIQPFLITVILAAVFAVILTPLYKKVHSYLRCKESVAAWVTLVLSVVGIVVPLVFLSMQLFQEAVHVYTSVSEDATRQNLVLGVMTSIGTVFEYFIPGVETYFINLSNNVDTYIQQLLAWVVDNLGSALSSVSSFLFDLLIFLIALYYFIKDGETMKKIIHSISPLGAAQDEAIFKRLGTAINSIVKGNLFIAFIQGVMTTVGFALCSIPNTILWGALAAVASLVPRVGTAMIIVPAIVYLLTIGSPLLALLLTLWGLFIVGMIDNILGPKLIGKEMELHPLSILLAVVGGILFFGPPGIFLGPLSISLLFALTSVYFHIAKHEE